MGALCSTCRRGGSRAEDAPTGLEGMLERLKAGRRDPELDDEVGIKVEEGLGYPSGSLAGLFTKPEPLAKAHGETHEHWENHMGSQVVQPLLLCKPTSLSQVGEILAGAARSGLLVKAAGSGHSYSDVATTPDYFIDTHDLCRVANETNPIVGQLRQQVLKPEWRADMMKEKWRPTHDLPNITVDSPLDEILRVRDVFEHNTMLFETEAGITIEQLNMALEEANLGLPNMGGYDGQTIMGAISTSTHGTGIRLPPFPDMLRSLVLATTGKWNGQVLSGSSLGPVNYYRIEPSNGITDPTQYRKSQKNYTCDGCDIQLIQDDDCFRAVMVNMGTMGVVYSVVIEVMQFYYLTETRSISSLDKSLALIQSLEPSADNAEGLPSVLRRYRHFQILISPYPMRNDKVMDMDPNEQPETYYPYFKTMHVHMNITPRKSNSNGPDVKPRNVFAAITGKLGITFESSATLANYFPKVVPFMVEFGFVALEDRNHVDKSYKIYNLGVHGDAGFANETGFPVKTQNNAFTTEHLKNAIDSIHQIAEKARHHGDQYQTSPFAVRFVRQSSAFLSMMSGVDTAMIELPMITGTYGGVEIVNRQQKALYELGGRPHWGLEFNQLTGTHDLIHSMYPEYPKWKKVYDQLNSMGTFNNRTTVRLGFSPLGFKRSGHQQ